VKFVVVDVETTLDGDNEPFVTSFDAFEGLSSSMELWRGSRLLNRSPLRGFLNLRRTSLLEEGIHKWNSGKKFGPTEW